MNRRQRLTLLAAIFGSALATIDGSIVNVALPAIENDLGGGLSGQQWVANAYLLALASLILIGGSLGDIYGERRVFAIGITAFGVVSIACALAPTIEVLIGARALQGAAAALMVPSSLAIIVAAFAPTRARGRDRQLDGVGRDRGDRRASRRRSDHRPNLVALDLRAQRANRHCDLDPRANSSPGDSPCKRAPGRPHRCCAGCRRIVRDRVRSHRATALRLEQPGDLPSSVRGSLGLCGLLGIRAPYRRADARARALLSA